MISLGGSSAPPLDVKMAAQPQIDWHRATERTIHPKWKR
jgi:hypothetical protein